MGLDRGECLDSRCAGAGSPVQPEAGGQGLESQEGFPRRFDVRTKGIRMGRKWSLKRRRRPASGPVPFPILLQPGTPDTASAWLPCSAGGQVPSLWSLSRYPLCPLHVLSHGGHLLFLAPGHSPSPCECLIPVCSLTSPVMCESFSLGVP